MKLISVGCPECNEEIRSISLFGNEMSIVYQCGTSDTHWLKSDELGFIESKLERTDMQRLIVAFNKKFR